MSPNKVIISDLSHNNFSTDPIIFVTLPHLQTALLRGRGASDPVCGVWTPDAAAHQGDASDLLEVFARNPFRSAAGRD